MAEQTLSSDLDSLQRLVEQWPDAVLVRDRNTGKIVIANAAAEQLLGYPRAALLDVDPCQINHPDDGGQIPLIEEQLDLGAIVRRPWRAIRADGAIINVEMTIRSGCVGDQRVAQMVMRMLGDEQPPSQPSHNGFDAQLAFLDRTGLTVVAIDQRGIVTYWNAAATEKYGFGAHEVIGRPLIELATSDEDRTNLESLMSHRLAQDEWVSKMLIHPRNREPFEAMVTGSILQTRDGEFGGMLFVAAPLEAAARVRTQRMRRAQVRCAACGREVAGTMRRKYCSEKCRQWAYYHRNLEAQRARSRERHERQRDSKADTGGGCG